MTTSLYERIGGQAAIVAAVDRFYQKVLADDLTRPFFDDLDMDALIKKQIAFMTVAFGGPAQDRGRPLRAAHAKLVSERGLGDAHFDRVAEHLAATLVELGVPETERNEALAIVAGARQEVLNR